jgi:hypothetical protein
MPLATKTKTETKREIRKRLDIIKTVLSLIKGKVTEQEYAHIKRLMTDGTERDLVFIQGLSTGIELAALNADDLKVIIKILEDAKIRGKDGKPSFTNSEVGTIDEILSHRFPLGPRRKMINVILRADNLLLDGLIETLKKLKV